MNELFLFLIALPLGLYLLALLFQTFEMDIPAPTEPASISVTTVDDNGGATHQEIANVVATETDKVESIQGAPEIVALAAVEAVPSIEKESASTPTLPPIEQTIAAPAIETEPIVASAIIAKAEPQGASAETIQTASLVNEPSAPVSETDGISTESFTPEIAAENAPLPETPAAELNVESSESDEAEPLLPEGPLELPEKGSPKFAFDYRGRLWIEKRNKGFFRQLRRPQLPPDEPPDKASRG